MTQRKGLRGILALLCAMTLLIGAIGPAAATEAAVPESVAVTTAAAPEGTPVAQTTKAVIASWNWVDPDKRVNQGVMEVSDKEGAVDYNGVYSLLPKEITATVEGQTAPVTIAVKDWHCPEFDASVPGDYTFKAEIAQDYTLGGNVPALEVKVRLIQEQPVADAPADTTGDTTTDTTGNTTAPTDSTPPAADVITVESWIWVDSMQALSDDGKLHLTEEITDANLPEIQKLLPQSIQAGEHTISLTWTYSKETKTFTAKLPDGYALAEGAAPLAVAVVVEEVTMLPESEIELYVSGQRITESGCYANQNGTWTKVEGTEPANGQFYYDADTVTLTLNQAEISHDGAVSVGSGAQYRSSVIAFSQSADVPLTIVVSQGTSTITGTGGIRVESTTGDVSLSIKGPGSLEVDMEGNYDSGISLIGSQNVNLNIDGADVKTLAAYYYGVDLHAGDGFKAAAVVNNGKLTAGGSGGIGIYYRWANPSNSCTSSLTVSGNAVVDTRNSKITTNNQEKNVQVGAGSDGSGGIVFNGKNGTVYGKVELQDDLTINEGETLTVGKDASLTVPDGQTLTNNGTIQVNGGTLTGKPGGNIVYATAITTHPENQTVTAGNTATFKITATGDELTYQWEQSTDNGSTWMDISGATTDTYTTAATTAEMNGYQYRCVVTGKDGEVTSDAATLTVTAPTVPVTGVTLDHTELSLFTGDSAALTATVKPDDAANKKVTWSSSESGVAAVDGNGKVTALKAGNTTITVTTEDGSKTATCKVTVSDKTYGISVDTEVDFGTAYSNYTQPEAKTVTIKNTGNQTVTLNQPASANFEIGELSKKNLPAGETATFTVRPEAKLTAGTYDNTIAVSGSNGSNTVNASVSVKFTVKTELQVTLTAANFTTTYNGSEVFPEAIHKTATCDGQAVSGTWSFVGGNPKDANVDESAKEQTKVLKFTPKDTEKYAEASIEVKVVIKKAPLKVSVKLSKTKIAVNSKLPTVSLSYSGLMGNDKMEPKVEPKFEGMPSGKKTGTYTIKLKNVDEMKEAINDLPVSKNYDITYVTSAKLSVVSGNNPLTADTSNIGMWTAIMIISGIGLIVLLVVMVVLKKKSKRRRPRYRRTPPKQED
ncbi:MAG TPA: Ig-like domain-containing protein [Candidatus Faecousia faecavium]|nr:Ig-like domain-containing protein [Candidatus Faecousia faecavium]